MELGVLTNLYASKSLDETLSILHGMGVTMAEIGCGGYPGKAHCDPRFCSTMTRLSLHSLKPSRSMI